MGLCMSYDTCITDEDNVYIMGEVQDISWLNHRDQEGCDAVEREEAVAEHVLGERCE